MTRPILTLVATLVATVVAPGVATTVAAITLAACGKDDATATATGAGTPGAGLVLTGPTLAPAGDNAPLTQVLTLTTASPVRVEAVLTSGTKTRTWKFADLSTAHDLTVVGFNPGLTWTVDLTLVEEDGARTQLDPLTVGPLTLQEIYPDFDVRTVDKSRAQPGYTLINLRTRGKAGSQATDTWTLLDDDLEPAWVINTLPQAKMAFQRQDGLFMGLDAIAGTLQGQYATARDLRGNIVREWHSDESWPKLPHEAWMVQVPGVWAFHHDLIQLPNGNFAVLTKDEDGFPVDDFPTDYDDPLVRTNGLNVNSDVIAEFDEDGGLVRTWDLGPLMDPRRIGYDSLDASFLDGRLDWIHANGLVYDAANDAFIVTFRHQDAIVKVSRASGQIDWIIGTPNNWDAAHDALRLSPVGALEWQYHQHSPDVSDDGKRVIVFDNGNWRASPWDGTPDPDDGPTEMRSRIVEYGVDTTNRTVTQNWEFEPPDGMHSCPAVGGASYLDNGNVLATFALTIAVGGTLVTDLGMGEESVHILEFVPGAPHQVVGDVFIAAPYSTIAEGWQGFAAYRIASPYPPGTLLE